MKWRILTAPDNVVTRWRFDILDGSSQFTTVRFIPNDMPRDEATKILKQAYEECYVRWVSHRAALSQPNDRESLRQLGFTIPSPQQWQPKFEDSDHRRVSWRN